MEVTTTKGRHFCGTVGLKAGYDVGNDTTASSSSVMMDIYHHRRCNLIQEHRQWMQHRHGSNQPWLGIIVGPVEDLSYAFELSSPQNKGSNSKDNDAALSSSADSTFKCYQEPVVQIHGEIASYQEHLTDKEIIETLQSLFACLGSCTKQTTVRFTFWGHDSYRESFRLRLPNTNHPLDNKHTVDTS